MTLPTSRDELVASTRDKLMERAPVIDWSTFLRWFNWKQGEHVGVIGPTGQGKTTFALAILPKRQYIVGLGTKPKDRTLERFGNQYGFERIHRWNPISDPLLHPRRLLWPDATSLYAARRQRAEFKYGLSSIYRQGNWTVYVDELWYLVHHLKLETEVRVYLLQARSNGVSLVVGTQRPAFVPLEVYDQSSWLVFFRDNDETNLKRISGISWVSRREVMLLVSSLEQHQALVVNTRTGEMVRTTVGSPVFSIAEGVRS